MKISIVTATWNSAETVRDTFDSVLRQEYKDYELVVVDGGSKDETVDIIREYEPKFEGRMKWKSEPDKGLYDAMNKGISRATGDVVGILNSDDFYTSFDVLQSVANAFAKHPDIDAVYGDIHYVKQDDLTELVRYYSSKSFRRSWMRAGFMPAHPSFYCRKSVYERFAKVKANENQNENENSPQSINHKPSTINLQYFDTSYKVAADFENLLRMIFVGRIKTHYIWKDFVTMRTGGASSSGMASHKQIERDHKRALKEHGVYSNFLLVGLRYLYKIGELVKAKLT